MLLLIGAQDYRPESFALGEGAEPLPRLSAFIQQYYENGTARR